MDDRIDINAAALCKAFQSFGISAKKAALSMRRVMISLNRIDYEAMFLCEHNRLPGSMRTKRLRKKRESVIHKWNLKQNKKLLEKR